MNQPPTDATASHSRGLAAALAPQLNDICENRLHGIVWFRTDWQRGGAATARALWRLDDGADLRVIVKLPIVQRELLWTQRLQSPDPATAPIVPRLYACGESIGGYDLAWIIIEQIEHGPLGVRWHDDHIPRIAVAAARFYAAAAAFPVDRDAKSEDWDQLLADGQKTLKDNRVPELQRWTTAMKKLRDRLESLVTQWNSRDCQGWVHGDLHPANAMCRGALDSGPVTLIDLAEVRPGHWIEDAVYLERLLWSSPDRLKGHKPVKAIAEARRAEGLPVEGEYPRLATIRRALLAGSAPRFIKSEGSPAYLAACLDRLEGALNELK